MCYRVHIPLLQPLVIEVIYEYIILKQSEYVLFLSIIFIESSLIYQ